MESVELDLIVEQPKLFVANLDLAMLCEDSLQQNLVSNPSLRFYLPLC